MATVDDADQRSDTERRRRAAAGLVSYGGLSLSSSSPLFVVATGAEGASRTLALVGAGVTAVAGLALLVLAVLALLGRLRGGRQVHDPVADARRRQRRGVLDAVVGVLLVGLAVVVLLAAAEADGLLRVALYAFVLAAVLGIAGHTTSAVVSWRARP